MRKHGGRPHWAKVPVKREFTLERWEFPLGKWEFPLETKNYPWKTGISPGKLSVSHRKLRISSQKLGNSPRKPRTCPRKTGNFSRKTRNFPWERALQPNRDRGMTPSHIRLLPEGAGFFHIPKFPAFLGDGNPCISSGDSRSIPSVGNFLRDPSFQAHSCTRKDLEKMYPAFPEFCAIRERLDPTGIFLNAYLEKVFF